MAPTPSPVLVHSSNPPSSRYLHRLRRQGLNLSRHPPRRSSPPQAEQSNARVLDAALQPSVALEGPAPPPIVPTLSGSVALAPEPSATPVTSNLPQETNPMADISGNIIAAVIVIVLILGGLIGLVIGGELLRRRARTKRKRVYPPPAKSFGRRKSQPIKNATDSPQLRFQNSREKSPYDEKALTPLTRPAPVLSRERQQRLSNVWSIHRLSRAMSNRRSCPEQLERIVPRSLPGPKVDPQTTWSEFSPVSLYVAPTRTILTCIPEELEDCHSQTNSDIAAILSVTFRRSLESGSMVSMPQANQPKSSHNVLLDGPDATELLGPQGCPITYKAGTSDEDAKSLGSSAPDMTLDGGESSRSSMASLESLEGGNDRVSLREEVFELRRAQTRSMQMNKGVLLSLSLKDLDDGQSTGTTHGECDPSCARSSCASSADVGKGCVERELSLAVLEGNFTAVDLDEFPSPPSILPMIPSFVSGF
ncbi:hypothetical protein L210DRAFT_3530453 [Boletus edulis BED1]|uniref:Uncharacterized protein n=1 Tax=Boletus edulis BED1 TaxID=1328754 RepID=A0AAD4GH59_BOLED|nr:hypothetical protein L210DRAFT_3530453 [Boletus edulis BED1]